MLCSGKRFLVAAGLAVLVFVGTATVSADPVFVGAQVKLYDGPGGNGGGEFFADVQPFGGSSPYDFITFCLQRNEYFYGYGTTMYIGGISDHTLLAYDPISPATAYLYTQFRSGTLAGYDFSGSTRAASATALQLAFWFLEGEATRPTGDDFYDAYNNVFLGTSSLASQFITAGQSSGWTDLGRVRVLNLYGRYNGTFSDHWQDQLAIPEPASLALLGLGLLGVGIKLRRPR